MVDAWDGKKQPTKLRGGPFGRRNTRTHASFRPRTPRCMQAATLCTRPLSSSDLAGCHTVAVPTPKDGYDPCASDALSYLLLADHTGECVSSQKQIPTNDNDPQGFGTSPATQRKSQVVVIDVMNPSCEYRRSRSSRRKKKAVEKKKKKKTRKHKKHTNPGIAKWRQRSGIYI